MDVYDIWEDGGQRLPEFKFRGIDPEIKLVDLKGAPTGSVAVRFDVGGTRGLAILAEPSALRHLAEGILREVEA
jgi:hypothetical protein